MIINGGRSFKLITNDLMIFLFPLVVVHGTTSDFQRTYQKKFLEA